VILARWATETSRPRSEPSVDRDWPFTRLPESFGTAVDKHALWYCAVVGPDEAAALDLDTATWDTRWRAVGDLYQIVAAPILPDESGCPTGN
jgi:hypothetical protein